MENLSLVACVSRRGVGFDLGFLGRCLSLLMLCFVSAPAVAGEAAGAASKPSCPKGQVPFEFRAIIGEAAVISEGAVGVGGMSSKSGVLPVVGLVECEIKEEGPMASGECFTHLNAVDRATTQGEGDVIPGDGMLGTVFPTGLWKIVRVDKAKMVAVCGGRELVQKGSRNAGCLEKYMHVDRKSGEVVFRGSIDESAPPKFWIADDSGKYVAVAPRCIPKTFEQKRGVEFENALVMVHGSVESRSRSVLPEIVPVIMDIICMTEDEDRERIGCATQRFVLGPAKYGDMEVIGKGGRVGMRRIQSAWWNIFKMDESLIIAKCADRSTFVPGRIAAACPDVYMHVNRKTGAVTFHETADPASDASVWIINSSQRR